MIVRVWVLVFEITALTNGASEHVHVYVIGREELPSALKSAVSHAAMLLGPFIVILRVYLCMYVYVCVYVCHRARRSDFCNLK